MTKLPNIVEEQFAALGIQLASCNVVRDFPWSRVLRLTTSDGHVIWVKRCGDGMSFEPDLTRVIESVGSPLLIRRCGSPVGVLELMRVCLSIAKVAAA